MISLALLIQRFLGFNKNTQNNNSSTSQKIKAIIGDVGGTNVRLALIEFEKNAKSYNIIKRTNFETKNYESLEACLREFLKDVTPENHPLMARIGIAGAVFNNSIKISNLPHWPEIFGDKLGQIFGIKSFKIYNDFEIASYGVINLRDDQLIQLNNAQKSQGKPMSVLGAGTGLGVSFIGTVNNLQQDGSYKTDYHVFPGEGGHGTFPQVNQEQQEYYNFLKTKYPQKGDHVALEYGLVGPAIPYIYEFCKLKYPNLQQMSSVNIENDLGSERFQSFKDFPRKEVFNYGKQKKDKLCKKALDFFLELYGISIGDICLRTLCYGGVYLCGGISISVAEYILENKEDFMKQYIEMRPYLKDVFDKIPIYVVKEEDIGLDGAFMLAQQDASKL